MLEHETDSRRPVLLVDGARNADGRVAWWSMTDLVEELTRVRWAEAKIDAPGWLPVEMLEGSTYRRRDNIARVWALVCDIDDQARGFDALVGSVRGLGVAAIVHTTWSHTPEHPKARVVFPLLEAVPAADWLEVWKAGAEWARTWGAEVDKACKDPSRLYFLPAVDRADWWTRKEWFDFEVLEDLPCLCWRWLVANHAPKPPERIVPRLQRTNAGLRLDQLDRQQRRRRKFAQAVLDRRCELVRQASPGKGQIGRNGYSYTGARAAGQLIAAGVLEEQDATAALLDAAIAAGLDQGEAARAIRNGIHKGKGDGAWTFSND